MNATTPLTDPERSDKSKTTSETYFDNLTGLDKDQKVYELASLFMEVQDIAYFIGMTPDDLAKTIKYHPSDPLSIAYHRGQLKTKIMLRFDARNYAMSGSPEATKEMLEHLSQQLTSEDDA